MNKYIEMIVVQRDYIHRYQSTPLRYKSFLTRKRENLIFISPVMITIILSILLAFIGSLYFVTHYKKEKSRILQNNKVISSNNFLLKTPKERWHYIRELENSQFIIQALNELFTDNKIKNANQFIDKQYRLSAQWNEQTLDQHHHLQIEAQQQQQQHWIQTQYNTQLYHQLQQQTRTVQLLPIQQKLKILSQKQTTQLHHDLIQTIKYNTKQQSKTQQIIVAHQAKKETELMKQTEKHKAEIKDEHYWIVQCGSFRDIEQAGTVHAQLAFKGFDSRIIIHNDWNRVVIGPVKGKDNVDYTVSRLKITGYTNCIRLVTGS